MTVDAGSIATAVRRPGRPRPSRRATTRSIVVVTMLWLLLSGAGLAAVESQVAGSFWQDVWWSVSLLTTVGFVGGAPTTVLGQVLSTGLMLCGVLLIALLSAVLASAFVREDERPAESRIDRAVTALLAELAELRLTVTALGVEVRALAPAGPGIVGRIERVAPGRVPLS